jgi:hypothetical protein
VSHELATVRAIFLLAGKAEYAMSFCVPFSFGETFW